MSQTSDDRSESEMRSPYDLMHLEVWKKVDQEATDRPRPKQRRSKPQKQSVIS